MSDIIDYKPNNNNNEMEYRILSADNTEKLEEEVMDYIKEGWTPFGGVSVSRTTHHIHFYQTIIRNFSMSMKLPCKE